MTTPEPLPQSELERIKALCEKAKEPSYETIIPDVEFTFLYLIALPKCVAEIKRLNGLVDQQSKTITQLCEAIDPEFKHGPETEKLASYAVQTRKLALDIAISGFGNLNYTTNKAREIRAHLDFVQTVNGGIQ